VRVRVRVCVCVCYESVIYHNGYSSDK
jgi:hypothetical protein